MDKFEQVVCLYVNDTSSEGNCFDCGKATSPLDEYIFVKKDFVNGKFDESSCQWLCEQCALEYDEAHGYWTRKIPAFKRYPID